MKKKILILLFTLSSVLLMNSVNAKSENYVDLGTHVNPEYEYLYKNYQFSNNNEVYDETQAEDEIPVFSDIASAAEYVKKQMILRNEIFYWEFKTKANPGSFSDIFAETFEKATMHDQTNPKAGDYIANQYITYSSGCKYSSPDKDGYYSIIFHLNIKLFTTAEQEAEVDSKITEVLNDLKLDGLSNYEKVLKIYSFITKNTSYDYSALTTGDLLAHSAYAALIKQTSVCQGYALLFYRMALEAGIDVRYISGDAGLADNPSSWGGHAWNIVKIGSLYYNIDSTWDETANGDIGKYNYFLLNDANLNKDHRRDAKYNTPEFYNQYVMSPNNYEYTVEIFKVTFSFQGWIWFTEVTKGYCVEEVYFKEMEKEGYKLTGWYLDGKKYDFNTPVTKDITLEAKYEKIEEEQPVVSGDLNNDGKFNLTDILYILRGYFDNKSLSTNPEFDANKDGKFNLQDVLYMLKAYFV